MHRVAFLTNMPVPYREPVHKKISDILGPGYHVIYANRREIDRKWSFTLEGYSKTFLKEKWFRYKNRVIHCNLDIWGVLSTLDPDVVITTGFNPTFLLAFVWAKIKRKKHICMTDGWLRSEKDLSFFHRFARKLIYKRSAAFVGASEGSCELYRHYGCKEIDIFKSPLSVNNSNFSCGTLRKKTFDLMFSGQIIGPKLPLFFAEVAGKVRLKLGACRVLIIGSGELESQLLDKLRSSDVEFEYGGFVDQENLIDYYSRAKVFLFPTLNDAWGVVVNEACATGLPVLTCKNAGVANDLVLHGQNGYVLPLDCEVWSDHIVELLQDENLYRRFCANSLKQVERFNFDESAKGLIDAINYCKC
jgi:glycosyltransferase involved in cell wall biosynthesis